jgi:hypothetical protein
MIVGIVSHHRRRKLSGSSSADTTWSMTARLSSDKITPMARSRTRALAVVIVEVFIVKQIKTVSCFAIQPILISSVQIVSHDQGEVLRVTAHK